MTRCFIQFFGPFPRLILAVQNTCILTSRSQMFTNTDSSSVFDNLPVQISLE